MGVKKETLLALERAGFRKNGDLRLIESYLHTSLSRSARSRFGWPKLALGIEHKIPERCDQRVVCSWVLVVRYDFMVCEGGTKLTGRY